MKVEAIISDTTALIVLAKSDTLGLLGNIFEEIFIPQAVQDELDIKDDVVKYRITHFDKISIKAVTDTSILNRIRKFNIDSGEAEAISLALELDYRLIIDERKGRKIAISQGLKVVGVLGILIENYKQGFISLEEAFYFFELFKKNGLRISNFLEEVFVERLRTLQLGKLPEAEMTSGLRGSAQQTVDIIERKARNASRESFLEAQQHKTLTMSIHFG